MDGLLSVLRPNQNRVALADVNGDGQRTCFQQPNTKPARKVPRSVHYPYIRWPPFLPDGVPGWDGKQAVRFTPDGTPMPLGYRNGRLGSTCCSFASLRSLRGGEATVCWARVRSAFFESLPVVVHQDHWPTPAPS